MKETPGNCCAFCCKSEDEVELVDMELNSLKLEHEEVIEFSDLLTEILNLKISSGYICSDCQNQAIQFYIFKKSAQQNINDQENIQRSEVLKKLDLFLDDWEYQENLTIMRYHQCFIVVPETKRNLMQNFQTWQPRVHLEKEEPTVQAPEATELKEIHGNAEQVEEVLVQSNGEEYIYEDMIIEEEEEVESPLIISDEFAMVEEANLPHQSNSEPLNEIPVDDGNQQKLVKENREWANETIKSCYLVQQSDDGEVPAWKCLLCSKVYNSPQALRLHLLAKHLEEDQTDLLSDEVKEWIEKEIEERKILIESIDGSKLQWDCGSCSFSCNFVKTFKIHLIGSHANKPKVEKQEHSGLNLSLHQTQWIEAQLRQEPNALNWQCRKCKAKFANEKLFRQHLIGHVRSLTPKDYKTIALSLTRPRKLKVTSLLWTCRLCWFQYSSQRAFDSHTKLHETLNGLAPMIEIHWCQDCNIFFKSDDDLRIHIEGHAEDHSVLVAAEGVALQKVVLFKRLAVPEEENLGNLTCGHCAKKFSDETICKTHLILHHINPLVCPKDGRSFLSIQPFASHVQKVHADLLPQSLLCTHCNKSFGNIYDRLAHMKECDAKKFTCDHCDKKFSSKNYLNAHLKREMGLLSCACSICGKVLKAKDELTIHLRTHTKEKPFKCSMCDKRYTTTSARASHMETHNDTPIECQICKVKFIARRHYKVHYKRYHDEVYRQKKLSDQTCPICSKQFLRKERLKEHIQKHAVES